MLRPDHRSSSEPGVWGTLGLCGRKQQRSTCASPERCPSGFQRRVNSPLPTERRLPTVTRAPPVCRSVGITHTRRCESRFAQCEVPDADSQNLTAAPSKSAPIIGVLDLGERARPICAPFLAESLGGSFVPVGLHVRISIPCLPCGSGMPVTAPDRSVARVVWEPRWYRGRWDAGPSNLPP